MIWWIILILIWPFAIVIIFGAPYLPTRNKTAKLALEMLDLKPDDLLVDLGVGDGAVLMAAAQAGLRGVGYELNPFLYIVSVIRLRKYRSKIKIYFGDFWHQPLPDDTSAVYVFLHTRFMDRLDKKIKQHGKHLKVVSYTFKIPNKKLIKEQEALFLYKY